MMKRRVELLFCIIAVAVVVIDQLVKSAIEKIPLNTEILFPFFSITHVHNLGASFGILQGSTTFLIWFSVAVLTGIVWHLKKTPWHMVPFVALIASGAVSNLIDRVNLGYVVDYINFWYIPTFNVADIAITVGTVGLGVLLYVKE